MIGGGSWDFLFTARNAKSINLSIWHSTVRLRISHLRFSKLTSIANKQIIFQTLPDPHVWGSVSMTQGQPGSNFSGPSHNSPPVPAPVIFRGVSPQNLKTFEHKGWVTLIEIQPLPRLVTPRILFQEKGESSPTTTAGRFSWTMFIFSWGCTSWVGPPPTPTRTFPLRVLCWNPMRQGSCQHRCTISCGDRFQKSSKMMQAWPILRTKLS